MKSILVPVDFSRYARRAADRATRLGAGPRHVHLVHVRQSPVFGVAVARTEVTRRLELEATRLRRKCERDSGSRTTITTHVLDGQPHVEIVRQARAVDADVIVLGCKGAGERPAKVLGRTAARVVRMAETPVLVVRRPAREPYRRPLVALPLDPTARRLVKLVQSAVGKTVAITGVRSYHVPFTGLIDTGSDARPTEFREEIRGKVEREMRDLLESLRGGAKIRARVRAGDAREVILAEAAKSKADLVALGTHGRSGLAYILLGSVAEWVLVHARADVLVARPVRFTFERA